MKTLRSLLHTFWHSFLPENTVLVQALGIAPILAVGVNLKYGVALSACTVAVLLPVILLLSLLGNRVKDWLRPPLYALLSALFLLGAAWILRSFVSVEIYAHLYLFLPLMAVTTLMTTHRPDALPNRAHLVADTLGTSLGFALVLCVASALRELAIHGTLWDIPLGYTVRFPEAEHPFIGFILLAFMAATVQRFKQLSARRKHTEERGLEL